MRSRGGRTVFYTAGDRGFDWAEPSSRRLTVNMSGLREKIRKNLHYYGMKALVYGRTAWGAAAGVTADRPIFVVGCSRAGTTLVYKTFSESREIGTLQRETHDFWADLHPPSERGWDSHGIEPERACEEDRRLVSRYFYGQTGNRRFVDKNNQNGLSILYLQHLFPEAYFVYIKRSPGDNINSLIEGWNRPDEYARWSRNLPDTVQVDGGRFTRWSFFLADGWRDYRCSPIEQVCAFQYVAMNEAILSARAGISDGNWVELTYEDLLEAPVEGFEAAFARCELPFTPALRRHCNSVLSRPYNAFSEVRRDKWRESANRDRIEAVLPTVEPVARQMGY